ncbi:hypothetical protein JM93_04071 [Roseibium hamelinense]|uniref:YdaS antitoxin of YdaST toxin-antitoxin system n=1 Tax=Roseibium hamelinense TaxID=150831 RepID=A0A562SF43_9HYPH|nr:hypothetical protein [Roseibium hamelinense]MTI44256.1 hypothetical protein [Roseibium hamelinense]TWI79959.1 hypothetical protein JM93_04071 [Roseibium hamelinense]
MNADEFQHWCQRMGFKSTAATAEALGIGSRNTIAKFRKQGAPRYIALACAALVNNLPPYATPDADAAAKESSQHAA